MNRTVAGLASVVTGSVRKLLLPVLVVGLILSNVASIVSERFHDALFGAVASIATVAGNSLAGRLMAKSPQARKQAAVDSATLDMKKRLALETSRLHDLKQDHETLKTQHGQLKKRSDDLVQENAAHAKARKSATAKTRELAERSKKRLAKTVARNTGALAGEAVPGIGLIVAVGVAALDVADACEALKDWNDNLREFGEKELSGTDVCGVAVPSSKEVLAKLKTNWRQSTEAIAKALGEANLPTERPVAEVPTWEQVKQATCPVVKLVGMCP